MAFPVTRRLMGQIDELLTLRAIQHVYKELTDRDPEVPATKTEAWLEDLCRQLLQLVPSEDERLRRLREAADAMLPQVVEEKVQQLTDAEVADIQFESGDIAQLCFSDKEPPKGINPTVHAMVLQQLVKTGRLTMLTADSPTAGRGAAQPEELTRRRLADGVDETSGRMPGTPADISEIKKQILKVLDCGEATDGLYFRNFYEPWDEGMKPAVEAPQSQIIEALKELIAEGKVVMDDTGKEALFHLANPTRDET